MPPITITQTREASVACLTCGSTLVRTGKPVTFGEQPVQQRTAKTRFHPAWKGWVPSLLVTICPACDSAAIVPVEDQQLQIDAAIAEMAVSTYGDDVEC